MRGLSPNGGSYSIAEKYVAVPYKYDENNANILWVTMADPMDMVAIDDFAIITNLLFSL